MNKKEISSRNNLYRRNFLSGIAAIAATTTPSLAGSAPVGAGQNLPQTAPVPTSRPNGRLRDKVAVVTGAARGISRATALAFAREAPTSSVSISVRRWTRVPVLNHRPKRTGRKPDDWYGWLAAAGWGIKLDQRDLPALRAAGVRGEREFGGIDILFANAGIQSFHPLLEMEDPDGYSKRRSGFRALYCEARWRTHHLDLLDRRAARHQVRKAITSW
jgi:NAD(P)-dependent dehydrogenase (short-subunit alcohol dehydrogenase family)